MKLAKLKLKTQKLEKKIKTDDSKKLDDLPLKIPQIPFNAKTMKQLMESEAVDRLFFNEIYDIESLLTCLYWSVR